MQVGVAGEVPAVLARTAAGARRRGSGSRSGRAPRAARPRPAARSRPSVVDDRRLVARHRLAGRAGPASRPRRAEMKMCSISVAPMPSMISMPGRLVPRLEASPPAAPRRPRRTCARHDTSCSPSLASIARYAVGAVKQTVAPMLRDRRAAARPGARLLEQHGRGADAQREQHEAAEPEGERERRRADEDVVRLGAQHVRREAVADRQHVAVEVHRALRLAGGAGGEGDQRDVVGRGVDRRRSAAGVGRQRLEAVRRAVAAVDDALRRSGASGARRLQLLGEAVVAQRVRDLRLVDDRVASSLRAQQRHRRDDDAAGLQHGEPARGQHRRVGGAQQHAVARHEPESLDQHVGDPVRPARRARA